MVVSGSPGTVLILRNYHLVQELASATTFDNGFISGVNIQAVWTGHFLNCSTRAP